jgi:plastocyanin
MLTRRRFLTAGGLALTSLAVSRVAHSRPWGASAAGGVVEVRMRSDDRGAEVWFDPIGVLIEPGQTVRWIMASPGNPHTTTAYHPRNASHSLRIPEAAAPWDSGFLINPGDLFEVTLSSEGVYDYFCLPHEAAGMVGRIVVGRPGGPGMLPFDYFAGRAGAEAWLPVPEAARAVFPSVAAIMAHGIARRR